MGGIRPTQFTQITTLTGVVELYTQLDGAGNAKLTVQQVADFTKDQFSAAAVVETVAYKLPFFNVVTGTHDWTKLYIPNPTELHPDANKIEIKVVASYYIEFLGQQFIIEWNDPISGDITAIDFTSPSDTWKEIERSEWIVPAHTGIEVQLKATNNIIDSSSDVLNLFESSIVLIRATKV
jgi:hypothetical protein